MPLAVDSDHQLEEGSGAAGMKCSSLSHRPCATSSDRTRLSIYEPRIDHASPGKTEGAKLHFFPAACNEQFRNKSYPDNSWKFIF